MRIVLALQLVQHHVAVLALPVRRRRPVRTPVLDAQAAVRLVPAIAVAAADAGARAPLVVAAACVALEERAARVALV